MKISLLTLISLLGLSFVFAQENAKAWKFAETITAKDLHAHLSFLSDDLLEGRETGKRGQHLTALYIKTQFMKMGLEPGNRGAYIQEYSIYKESFHSAKISLGKKNYHLKDNFLPIGTPPNNEVRGELIFAGYGITNLKYNNLEHLDFRDKVVLVLGGNPTQIAPPSDAFHRIREQFYRAEYLLDNGASMVCLVVADSQYQIIRPFFAVARQYLGDETPNTDAMVLMTETMAAHIFKQAKTSLTKQAALLEADPRPAKLDFRTSEFHYVVEVDQQKTTAQNVLGIIRGSEKPDEYLIITAHMDHLGIRDDEVYNGADDDGSGTAALLELAEAYALAAAAGHPPRRSILFMSVSGEEKGLWGSEFYAKNPIYPLESTTANLNIDMIGRTDPAHHAKPDSANYTYLIGAGRISSELDSICRRNNERHTQLSLDYTYDDEADPNRFYYRSDHYNFAKRGVPVVFFFAGTHADYHKPTDTIEKINFEKASKITRLVFVVAWELANREELLERDRLEVEEGK